MYTPHFSLTAVFFYWVVGFGFLFLLVRDKTASFFHRVKAPLLLRYYLILTPVALVEEAFTIQNPYFWGILPIMISFYIYYLVIFIIQKTTRVHWLAMCLINGLLGWINEFLLGGMIHKVPGLALLVMSPLCILIYAVMTILPAYWLYREQHPPQDRPPEGK
jgi:hypothetical protein